MAFGQDASKIEALSDLVAKKIGEAQPGCNVDAKVDAYAPYNPNRKTSVQDKTIDPEIQSCLIKDMTATEFTERCDGENKSKTMTLRWTSEWSTDKKKCVTRAWVNNNLDYPKTKTFVNPPAYTTEDDIVACCNLSFYLKLNNISESNPWIVWAIKKAGDSVSERPKKEVSNWIKEIGDDYYSQPNN